MTEFGGKTPYYDKSVYIAESAVLIGDVKIDTDSSVWPTAVIRGDMNTIRIGARTSIQDGAILHITHKSRYNPSGYSLNIGNNVTVGHKAVLHGCTIGNRCLIGIGSIVMDGAVVENEVIVAAGCLVPPGKHLKAGSLYIGSPAKEARTLTEAELQFILYSSKNYVKLKDKYIQNL